SPPRPTPSAKPSKATSVPTACASRNAASPWASCSSSTNPAPTSPATPPPSASRAATPSSSAAARKPSTATKPSSESSNQFCDNRVQGSGFRVQEKPVIRPSLLLLNPEP